MSRLGESEELRSLVAKTFSSAEATGWYPWYDGGLKLDAAKCLIELEGEKGRQQVIEHFVDDYISRHRYPREIILSFLTYANILFEEIPTAELWEDIAEHVYQLNEFRHAELTPTFPADERDELSISELLVDIVFERLISPIPEIRGEALKCVVSLGKDLNAVGSAECQVRFVAQFK